MAEPDRQALERVIFELLARRAPGATICPSDVARAWSASQGEAREAWRRLMEPTREVARELARRGALEITQRGEVVEGAVRGPIRLRLAVQRVRSR